MLLDIMLGNIFVFKNDISKNRLKYIKFSEPLKSEIYLI